jgi:hypothetical protein
MDFNHTENHMRSPISVYVLLALLLIAAPQTAQAQQFGILGGANFAGVTGDDVPDDIQNTTGLVAGVFGRIGLGQIITFQPEVHYSQKGWEEEGTLADRFTKFDYVDVPLFLSFGFPNSFHAMVGPNFAFEIGCDVEIDPKAAGEEQTFDCDDDDDDDGVEARKDFVAGAVAGLGIDFPLGGLNLFIDGRFNIDLESIDSDDDGDQDIKNRVFQVVGGIRFGGIM